MNAKRAFTNAETSVHDEPKSVFTMKRNDRSRTGETRSREQAAVRRRRGHRAAAR